MFAQIVGAIQEVMVPKPQPVTFMPLQIWCLAGGISSFAFFGVPQSLLELLLLQTEFLLQNTQSLFQFGTARAGVRGVRFRHCPQHNHSQQLCS